jgi:HK97 family phage major capsid protein
MRRSTREAILAELKAARDIAEFAESEDRDVNADERGRITVHLSKAEEMRTQAEAAGAVLKELGSLGHGVEILPSTGDDDKAKPEHFSGVKRGGSVGQQFVDSTEFKALMGSVPEGRFSEKARVQSQPYGVKSLITGLADSSAGALVTPQPLGLVPAADPFLSRPLTVRQLFSSGSTSTDSVEFVRILAQTNNAAPVPEATSSAVVGDGTGGTATAVTGGVKPESGFTFEKQSTTVKTIATWIPATKRSLSDASQVKTLIDTFLRYGLEEEFEDQLISGNGSGENFLGINNTSGIQTQAAPGAGEDNFTVTRRARRKVTIGGRATPTAFVLNPIDWENIELKRDATERFFGSGPFAMTPGTLWGLPVVESEAVAQGTGWCADWRMGIIWDREQASIQVSDSHQDFFIRNLTAILAEMRAAFSVLRPAAFVKITLT